MGLDSSHPSPDPGNPLDAELLSSGFVVLLGTPPGKPTACALNGTFHSGWELWSGCIKNVRMSWMLLKQREMCLRLLLTPSGGEASWREF